MKAPLAILVGNPNCGKTTLFNALTGLSARVGNYPGITVEHREGVAELGGDVRARVLDLPGTYSLVPRSDDEVVAVRGVLGTLPETPAADVVIVVVDATALERNLYLTSQLRELPLPLVVALTMTDTLERDGLAIDLPELERRLGVPVVAAPGVRGGAQALRDKLRALLGAAPGEPVGHGALRRLALNPPPTAGLEDESLLSAGQALAHALRQPGFSTAGSERALGLLAASVQAMGTLEKLALPAPALAAARAIDGAAGIARAAVDARYARVAEWTRDLVQRRDDALHQSARDARGGRDREPPSVTFTRKVDAVALHPVLGIVILVGIFLLLFQALFSWSTPVMDGIEALMGLAGERLGGAVPDGLPLVRSLLVNGVVAGVGNVVVFVPQIAVLFLFLSLLEDSGYLARAAFLLDRLMARVGLHGRAFVPLLSGFACAVPAILATRTIENDKDRIVTILVTPLVSCSARLPVYALMIATVFSTQPPIFGFLAPGAVVMVAMYGLSLTAAVGMAAVFKRTILKSPTPPLVLELPPYRWPQPGQLTRAVTSRVKIFLTEAGTVILAITVVLWGLFTFPIDHEIEETRAGAAALVEATMHAGEERDAELGRIEAHAAREQVAQSVAGRLGHALEPVLSPLGFDWKLGVGIIASFAAREVLVSTLGLVYGLGDGTDEESPSLREAMRADRHADGAPVYTPLVGLSLLVFFVLAMQCMSTLAAVRRETRGWKWPLFQLAYMTALAYGASLLVYQGGKLLGLA
jgi:ferrous iron transport protein B